MAMRAIVRNVVNVGLDTFMSGLPLINSMKILNYVTQTGKFIYR